MRERAPPADAINPGRGDFRDDRGRKVQDDQLAGCYSRGRARPACHCVWSDGDRHSDDAFFIQEVCVRPRDHPGHLPGSSDNRPGRRRHRPLPAPPLDRQPLSRCRPRGAKGRLVAVDSLVRGGLSARLRHRRTPATRRQTAAGPDGRPDLSCCRLRHHLLCLRSQDPGTACDFGGGRDHPRPGAPEHIERCVFRRRAELQPALSAGRLGQHRGRNRRSGQK